MDNVKWAKHVGNVQPDWLLEHRALMKPSTKSRISAPPVQSWASAFRRGARHEVSEVHEKKCARLKHERRMVKLQMAHLRAQQQEARLSPSRLTPEAHEMEPVSSEGEEAAGRPPKRSGKPADAVPLPGSAAFSADHSLSPSLPSDDENSDEDKAHSRLESENSSVSGSRRYLKPPSRSAMAMMVDGANRSPEISMDCVGSSFLRRSSNCSSNKSSTLPSCRSSFSEAQIEHARLAAAVGMFGGELAGVGGSLGSGVASTRSSGISSATGSKRSSVDRGACSKSLDHADAESQVSKQPILEEEDEAGFGEDEAQDKASSMNDWAELRAEFPLDVLDALADFYEKCPVDEEGYRFVSIDSLDKAVSMVLCFPAGVASREAAARGVGGSAILFPSLWTFLAFIRATVERVEKEDSRMLWSDEDLHLIAEVFKDAAEGDQLPPSRLVAAIEELGFDDLEVSTPEQKMWLFHIQRAVLDDAPVQHAEAAAGDGSGGPSPKPLSLDDFVRLVSAALKERERFRRAEEFARERQVGMDCSLSPLDIDVFRALHRACMEAVLAPQEEQSLGDAAAAWHLSGEEQTRLLQMAREHASQPDGSMALALDAFIRAAKSSFKSGLGSMLWTTDALAPFSPQDLEGRRGFAVAMLRETMRSSSGSSCHTRRSSSSSSRRSSGNTWKLCSYSSSPRKISKCSRSGKVSVTCSHQGSRPASRGKTRSATLTSEAATFFESEDVSGVLNLKGLPPSEAMLARKPIRAISVDLGQTLPLHLQTALAASSQQAPGGAVPTAPTAADDGPSPAKRRVKPAQDSLVIVTDAIAKLSADANQSSNSDMFLPQSSSSSGRFSQGAIQPVDDAGETAST